MSTPASDPNKSSKMKKLMNGDMDESIRTAPAACKRTEWLDIRIPSDHSPVLRLLSQNPEDRPFKFCPPFGRSRA